MIYQKGIYETEGISNNDANDKSSTTKLGDFDPVMDTVLIC